MRIRDGETIETDKSNKSDRGPVESLTEKARENLDRARETFKGLYEDGVEKAKSVEDRIEARIQERPIRSLLLTAGIAIGVGVLLGILIRR